jgi:CDGSH-type Zn-finger protein
MDKNMKSEAIIEVIDNGPLRITGKINITDQARGINDIVDEVYLCRCGKSSTKPYCNGSHKRQ